MSTVLTCALQAADEEIAALQRAAEEGTGDATTSAVPQVQLNLSKRIICGHVFLVSFA